MSMQLVDEQGLTAAYDRIRQALSTAGIRDLYLREIAPVNPTDSTVTLLRSTTRTGPEISGVRLATGGIGNVLVEKTYVYRST